MSTPIDRRQALLAFGALGAGALLTACGDDSGGSDATVPTGDGGSSTSTSTPSPGSGSASLVDRFDDAATCEMTTELTEGPYYLDLDTIRRDLREDRDGTTLRVGIRVLDAECAPVADAVVEIWHCDALGLYSGFEDASTGGGPGGGSATDDTTYLRGGQVTDTDGIAEFTTVYPGWYRGRTTHIHAKVVVNNRAALTTQLFFDDDLTAEVYSQEPYTADPGRDTFNDDDGIFDERLILSTTAEADGYLGLLSFVLT